MHPDYYKGLRDGIIKYAWWKNGTQYVGCGVYTLRKALEEIEKLEVAEAPAENHFRVNCKLVTEVIRDDQLIERKTETVDPQTGAVLEVVVETLEPGQEL